MGIGGVKVTRKRAGTERAMHAEEKRMGVDATESGLCIQMEQLAAPGGARRRALTTRAESTLASPQHAQPRPSPSPYPTPVRPTDTSTNHQA